MRLAPLISSISAIVIFFFTHFEKNKGKMRYNPMNRRVPTDQLAGRCAAIAAQSTPRPVRSHRVVIACMRTQMTLPAWALSSPPSLGTLGSVPGGCCGLGLKRQVLRSHTHSQAHTLLNDTDPGAPFIPRRRVDLVHLRGRRADQKHPLLLVGDIPNDEVRQ